MARIRSIKPEFWSSEQIMDCSPTARLLFIGLWNFCDDGGNHPASAKTIKAEIFPGDDIQSSDVQRLLDELSANGLITLYTASNKDFWHVNGWHHQKIDKPTLKHPPFIPDVSEQPRGAFDEPSPPEGKGEEGRGEETMGRERKGASNSPNPQPSPGEICALLKVEHQIIDINPVNPTLIALVNAGASAEEFKAAAIAAHSQGKAKFSWIIARVKGQREDAANLQLHKGPMPAGNARDQGRALAAESLLHADEPAEKDITPQGYQNAIAE